MGVVAVFALAVALLPANHALGVTPPDPGDVWVGDTAFAPAGESYLFNHTESGLCGDPDPDTWPKPRAWDFDGDRGYSRGNQHYWMLRADVIATQGGAGELRACFELEPGGGLYEPLGLVSDPDPPSSWVGEGSGWIEYNERWLGPSEFLLTELDIEAGPLWSPQWHVAGRFEDIADPTVTGEFAMAPWLPPACGAAGCAEWPAYSMLRDPA